MVEAGLIALIQAGLGTLATGQMIQLDPNYISATTPKGYTLKAITSEPSYVFEGQDGYTTLEVQIDCHGYSRADAVALALAIDAVFRGGYAGTLPDTDSTVVFGIHRQPGYHDGFSDANRSFVRSLEYKVDYAQQ